MDESYIRFRETNNWENERWRFYIPLRGNERAIRILADALDKLKPVSGCFVGKHVPYDIRLMPMAGDRVNRLCESGRGGYMAWYNKLEGRLDIRAVKRAVRLLAEEAKLVAENPKATRFVDDDLYKGGIAKMMRPWKRQPATTDWPTNRIRAALLRTPISKWGDKLPSRIGGAGSFQRLSGEERCWGACKRLREAGLETIVDVVIYTEKELQAFPGIGRETANLTRWMLQEIGLDFNPVPA